MIFAELLALVGLLGAAGVGISAIVAWAKKSDQQARDREARSNRMGQDLRDALKSRDYRKLDDWMLLYAQDLDENMRKHVQIRRDELYVESNS